MQNERIVEVVLIIGFVILSLGVHEAAHAWVAYLRGDRTAKDLGRMTLNPIVHVDLFMTILLPAILFLMGAPPFGGAKPVPVNPHRLRHPLRDMMLVAIAGPVSNLLLAVVFMVALKACVFWGGMDPTLLAPRVLWMSMYINLVLAVFNMIPIPPLDGSRVMAYLLPRGMREPYVGLERFGMLFIFGLLYLGVLNTVIGSTIGLAGITSSGKFVIVSEGPLIQLVHLLSGGSWGAL